MTTLEIKVELGVNELSPYKAYIKKRLSDAYPYWIPATVIYREILSQGYPGKLRQLRAYMESLKPVSAKPLLRFETKPGEQMQVDWAYTIVNGLYAFIATLGYSRMSYVEFVTTMQIDTLLQCHEHAFEAFGGVCTNIL